MGNPFSSGQVNFLLLHSDHHDDDIDDDDDDADDNDVDESYSI